MAKCHIVYPQLDTRMATKKAVGGAKNSGNRWGGQNPYKISPFRIARSVNPLKIGISVLSSLARCEYAINKAIWGIAIALVYPKRGLL